MVLTTIDAGAALRPLARGADALRFCHTHHHHHHRHHPNTTQHQQHQHRNAVHVWAPADQADQYPSYAPLLGAAAGAPPLPGAAELLIRRMDAAGVAGALAVQAGNHLYDHSYLLAALERYPDRLAGVLLADPRPASEGGGGAAEISRLARAAAGKVVGVRFNPYLWPEGELMTNQTGREMYAAAGELGLPVSHMPFKGLLRHIDEIEALATDCPRTVAIIDHFGFCACDDLQSEEWRRLRGLARFPQIYVKASALFRVSKQPSFPHADAAGAGLRALVDAFGAERVMWGTDFPWVEEKGGYAAAWAPLDAAGEGTGGSGAGSGGGGAAGAAAAVLSDEERRWVMGGALQALFPTAWGGGGKEAAAAAREV